MTYNAKELLEIFEEGLSSPTAQSLRDAVMEKNRDLAFEVIKSEVAFDDEACAVLYEHLTNTMLGSDLRLVEIPKAHWSALAEDFATKNAAMDYRNPETFLVRYGTMVFQTQPYQRDGWVIVNNVPGNRTVSWMDLHQIWRMQPK